MSVRQSPPWSIAKRKPHVHLIVARGEIIGEWKDTRPPITACRPPAREIEGNTAFMVKAVNCHDDLCAQLCSLVAQVNHAVSSKKVQQALGPSELAVLRDGMAAARSAMQRAEE